VTRWRDRSLTAWGALMIAMGGCASLGTPHRPEPRLATIVRAYQQGVRDGAAQLHSERERDLRTPWTAPVVQEVWVPARIVDAIFIPAHREWVVIHPADWEPRGGRAQAATPDRAAPRTERHP